MTEPTTAAESRSRVNYDVEEVLEAFLFGLVTFSILVSLEFAVTFHTGLPDYAPVAFGLLRLVATVAELFLLVGIVTFWSQLTVIAYERDRFRRSVAVLNVAIGTAALRGALWFHSAYPGHLASVYDLSQFSGPMRWYLYAVLVLAFWLVLAVVGILGVWGVFSGLSGLLPRRRTDGGGE
jgi:hypothetical protein